MTDSSGNMVGEQRYYPFGETRWSTGSMFTDKLFTGQREMAGLGIYHYGARFYSPKLGRFLSADTIVPGYANPQNLNRYSYVLNNPLLYTDPTGHKACELACPGEAIDPILANQGSAWEREWNPKDQKENEEKAEEIIYGVIEIVGSTLIEPVDWGYTAYHCINGECSAWMLFGALPVVPSALGKHVDDAVDVARPTYVFWSGGESAKTAARVWAEKNNGLTLEMTSLGRR